MHLIDLWNDLKINIQNYHHLRIALNYFEVNVMVNKTLFKFLRQQIGINLVVPCIRKLLQIMYKDFKRLHNLHTMLSFPLTTKPFGYCIYISFKRSPLINMILNYCNCMHSLSWSHSLDNGKSFIEMSTFNLWKCSSHQTSFMSCHRTTITWFIHILQLIFNYNVVSLKLQGSCTWVHSKYHACMGW